MKTIRNLRNLLCIVPPYFTSGAPPLGSASLLAYLRAHGHDDVAFLDLRLWVPNAYAPTYRASGVFGETYVMDIPDLPLVLGVLRNAARHRDPVPDVDDRFLQYCLERAISSSLLAEYLHAMNGFLANVLGQLRDLRFVGMSTWSSNYLTTLMAAAHLKRRPRPPFVVLGGPQTTESEASAHLALQSGLVDAVALGEGEETLLRLFEAHADSAEPTATVVPGSVRRNPATGVFESAPRALLRLSELPLPAFDKVPLMAYQRRHTPYRAVTFELSRGCTDKCVFCSEWVFWQKIRTAEIGQVVDGIERLQADYGCQVVWFMDSLMNANLHRVGQLAEELLRRGVNVKWGGYLRANIDKPTATLLKRAGCEFVFVGVESLSDETLALMHKRRTGTDNLQALEALLEGGVDRVVAGFIPGFPGDTRGRFMATAMELGRMHQRYPGRFRVNVEPFVVSPRQPLFADLGGNGLVGVPWQESYLDMAGEYRPIVERVLCSVEGANQGIDRAGELRVAQAVTATAPVGPDPFLYYETEPYSTVELQIVELSGGWYQGVMKGEGGTLYGLILSREDRSEYEALQRESTVGYGFGYGRKPHSPLFARPAFADFFRRVEGTHLVPPRGRQPEVRTGRYRRQPLRTGDRVALSPFAVARLVTGRVAGGEEPEILVLDLATGGSRRVGAEWEWLLRALTRPARMGTLLHGRADPEQVAQQIHDLVEAGVVWGEWNGQIRTQHPTAGRRPLELAAVAPAGASGAR